MAEHTNKSLAEWLAWLETLHPKNIELGLTRIQTVADRLKLSDRIKENNCSITTVAGTNGKGSFVATLEGLLLHAGETVGGFTSPHFLEYNERIRVNGKQASDVRIVEAFQIIEAARKDITLTYFEFGALAAILVFLRENVKHIVLEVGLGGRLDAVNIFDADIAALTSIDLDHQEWLGNSREQIGFEKAGIFRANKPAIIVDSEIPESVLAHANAVGVKLLLADRDLSWETGADTWAWRGQDINAQSIVFDALPIPQLPLASVAAAMQAFTLLGGKLVIETLVKCLSTLSLRGRFQSLVVKGRHFALDVAHNPAAAKYLANKLQSLPPRNVIAIFAVMKDKDYFAIMAALANEIDCWLVCGLPNIERAASSNDLSEGLVKLGLSGQSFLTVNEAYIAALELAQGDDLILVLGSFHTVAEVLALKDFATEKVS